VAEVVVAAESIPAATGLAIVRARSVRTCSMKGRCQGKTSPLLAGMHFAAS